MTDRRTVLSAAVLALTMGCSEGDTAGTLAHADIPGLSVTGGRGAEIFGGSTEITGATGATGTGSGEGDASGRDGTGGSFGEETLPPDFNQPCAENTECLTGLCIDGPEGKVCTTPCIENCPPSWRCEGVTNFGGDITFICVPSYKPLCDECLVDADCGGETNRCIPVADEGTFCTRDCSATAPCPKGYGCKALEEGGSLCFPVTGSCICTEELLDTEEECSQENGFGICRGVRRCAGPGGWTECSAATPAAEICDAKDNNCDGQTDENQGGGPCENTTEFGTCSGVQICKGAPGIVCSAKTPAQESCNGKDDDCDGLTDEEGAAGCTVYFEDKDKDGVGNLVASKCLCTPQGDYTSLVSGDCNDLNPTVKGGSVEICNGLDDDCDGVVDQEGSAGCVVFFKDTDGDGFGDETDQKCLCHQTGPYKTLVAGDCDDEDIGISPNAIEACNGHDDNCNGVTDEQDAIFCVPYLRDADKDGFGVTGLSQCLCAPAGDYLALASGDCDDTNPALNPKAVEDCDGIDNNCNFVIDDDCDKDNDGYCSSKKKVIGFPDTCPLGGGDCVDYDAGIYPFAEEVCDGVDNDCDGDVDEGVQAPCGGCEVVCLMGAGATKPVPFDTQAGQVVNGTGADENGNIVLDSTTVKFTMIWIANSAEGTISRLDTTTGREVARYSLCGDPSRTSVDSQGNAWIACRGDGRVAKVALAEDHCVDKNGDGVIQTSHDADGDGVIQPAEMVAGDECVLFTVTPDPASGIARAMGVDKNDHGWVGMWDTARLYQLHRDNGTVLKEIQLPANPYGLALDQQGIIWISGRGGNKLLRVDPATGGVKSFAPGFGCFDSYGIAVDEKGRIWLGNCCCSPHVRRFDPVSGAWAEVEVPPHSRGVAADGNGYVYAALDQSSTVVKINADTMAIEGTAFLGDARTPVGIAVDFDGMVWAINRGFSTASRIDPATMQVMLETPTGPSPYTYSDMTGFAQKTIVSPQGTYRHVFEGWKTGVTQWMQVVLSLATPEGTWAQIRVRAADSVAGLSAALWSPKWAKTPPNGPSANLSEFGTVIGRYLEVEVTLGSDTGNQTPILKAIDVVATPFNN